MAAVKTNSCLIWGAFRSNMKKLRLGDAKIRTVSTMSADGPVMQGASASVAMVIDFIMWILQVPYRNGWYFYNNFMFFYKFI